MSMVRKQLYYYWKKLSEKQSRKKLRAAFFKQDLERFENFPDKKSTRQVKQEMQALQRYWGCYPFQYFRHDFYRQDCTITVDEMKKYVPLFFLHYLFFPLSYKDYGVVCEDKLLTYAILKAYEIPQPQFLFCFDHDMFFNSANNPITSLEADAIITTSNANTVFVKPRFGSEGKGIAIFQKQAQQFIDEHNTILNHRFFVNGTPSKHIEGRDTSGFYIVQEGLAQHEELNRIYPHAVNTYRIITEYRDADVQVLFCVLRMGSGGRKIDNSSAGGIFVRVDLETGALYETAFAFDESTCTAHPDTGFIFNGAIMETWPAVKSFAIAAARKFREIRYLGWDVAVTPNDPSVIEINNKPDIAHIQSTYGGARDILNINPKEGWYQTKYTIKNV